MQILYYIIIHKYDGILDPYRVRMTDVVYLDKMLMKTGLNKIFLLLALATGVAFADPIPSEALAQSGLQMRDRQLRDIGLVMRGGRGGFIDVGYTYTPSSEQLQLKSKYGVHNGYAFRHHYGIFGSWVLDSVSHFGFLTWFDRTGWLGFAGLFLFPALRQVCPHFFGVDLGLLLHE